MHYVEACTEEMSHEEVNVTTSCITSQDRGDTVWIAALTDNVDLLNFDYAMSGGSQRDKVTVKNLREAQQNDPSIGKVLAFMAEGEKPSIRHQRTETRETCALLREWQKLEVGEDGLLRRRKEPNLQLVLPKKFHHIVYRELHQEMGHLGAERVV